MTVYTKTSQLLSLFHPATVLISSSIKIHFKSSIAIHSATRLSRGLLAFNLFNPNLIKNSSFPFRCLHISHVSSFLCFKTNIIWTAKFILVHIFSRSSKTVCLIYLSKKNIWVTHCTPYASNLLSSPVLCSELLRHVRQNTGYPESSFIVFLSRFIQTLEYCILRNNNQRTLIRFKMNSEVCSYAARYGATNISETHNTPNLRVEVVCW